MTESLSKEGFKKSSDFLLHSARGLERSTYKYKFKDKPGNKIIVELKHYQNPDGGFGHGLGPDLRSPLSTPIATTQAFQKIENLHPDDISKGVIKKGIDYLENAFNEELNRWFAVPKEVNNYPHAPWWHYDEEKEGTIIDESWGNPTAEIIGYLMKYDEFVDRIDTKELLDEAFTRLNKKDEFKSEHEIYCYLRLYRMLPPELSGEIRDELTEAVQDLVCTDSTEWKNYVPTPIDFVRTPKQYRFGISDSLLDENLDFLVKELEENEVIRPTWEWGQYEDEWGRAEQEWIGVLTLKALTLLDRFDRIEL